MDKGYAAFIVWIVGNVIMFAIQTYREERLKIHRYDDWKMRWAYIAWLVAFLAGFTIMLRQHA